MFVDSTHSFEIALREKKCYTIWRLYLTVMTWVMARLF